MSELYHWGVPGMKWGVRRYQNKDGSLTKAGRKRQSMSQDAREADVLKRKKVSEMTNSELRKLNERRNLERNYRQLNPSTITKGIAIAGTTAAALGTIVNLQRNGADIIKLGKSVVNGISKK